jgi:hypothetical protein
MIIVAIALLSLSLSLSSLTFLRNLIRSSSFSSPHSAWYFLASIYLLDILVLESNRPDRLQFWLFRFSGVRLLGTLAYSELCYKNVWNVSWSAQERSRITKQLRAMQPGGGGGIWAQRNISSSFGQTKKGDVKSCSFQFITMHILTIRKGVEGKTRNCKALGMSSNYYRPIVLFPWISILLVLGKKLFF